jgi:hypothetical protein
MYYNIKYLSEGWYSVVVGFTDKDVLNGKTFTEHTAQSIADALNVAYHIGQDDAKAVWESKIKKLFFDGE